MAGGNEQAVDILIRLGLLGKEKAEEAKDALGKLTEQTGEAGKATDKLEVSHHELHQIMHLIGHQTSPELGHALVEMMMGPTGAVLGFITLLSFAFEKFKKESENSINELKSIWDSEREALEASRMELMKFADELRKAAEDADPLKTKLEAAEKAIEAMAKAMHEFMDAQEAAEMAAAKGDEAAIARIHARYDAAKKVYDVEVEIRKLQEEAHDILARQAKAQGLAEAEVNAETRKRTVSGESTKSQEDFIKQNEDEYVAQMQIVKDSFGGVQGARDAANRPLSPVPIRGANESQSDYEQRAQEAEKERFAKRTAEAALKVIDEYDRDVEAIKRHKEAVAAATIAVDTAHKANVDNTAAITKETEELGTKRKGFETGRAGVDVTKAISIADKAAAGGTLTRDEQEYLRTVGSLVAGSNVNVATAERMFEAAKHIDEVNKNQDAVQRFMGRVVDVMEKMPDLKNIQDLEKRLEELARRIDKNGQ